MPPTRSLVLPTHPLELPEVLLYISAYLPLRHLPSCALVSKTWNQVVTPLIWKEIKYCHSEHGSDVIQRHRHLIKTLDVDAVFLMRCASIRFPNLESLNVGSGYDHPGFEAFIPEHPSASLQISVWGPDCREQPGIWDMFLGFNNIKSLELKDMDFDGRDTSSIWQLCTRLERLELNNPLLKGFNRPSKEFSRIKEMALFDIRKEDGLKILELLKRCPHLTTLICKFWGTSEQNCSFFRDFARLLSEGAWSDLKAITTKVHLELDSNYISAIIRGMKQIHVLSLWGFKPHHFDLLRPHLDTITEIDLGGGSTSEMNQEILSYSPMLKRFKATYIYGTDVAEGQPWVCLGLEKLDIGFEFEPLTIHHDQPLVFDQLSKLTRIEKMSFYFGPHGFGAPKESFDFRLEYGLHKLATLRRLSVFRFYRTTQRMGMEEIDWMLNHWKSLSEVEGRFTKWSHYSDWTLRKRLENHGIKCKDYHPRDYFLRD
ncbi:hypothetical protein BGZ65_007846 [Modicella reniformis]|uniref:F-box domain-containing protein n=1 Tax=Modicella reniformis TaxID=1440133 RepID=A0A9P6LT16_9FUNG|nr:hypothetical protein BGZ65_007846 [Modicella reniformis]